MSSTSPFASSLCALPSTIALLLALSFSPATPASGHVAARWAGHRAVAISPTPAAGHRLPGIGSRQPSLSPAASCTSCAAPRCDTLPPSSLRFKPVHPRWRVAPAPVAHGHGAPRPNGHAGAVRPGRWHHGPLPVHPSTRLEFHLD